MAELAPWPYGRMPSVYSDVTTRGHVVSIQATEDGHYGFVLDHGRLLTKVGPERSSMVCLELLRQEIARSRL